MRLLVPLLLSGQRKFFVELSCDPRVAQGLLRCVTTRDLALAEALNQVLGLFSNFDRVKVDLGE